MNNSVNNTTNDYSSSNKVNFIIFPLWVTFFTAVLVNLYRKCRNDMRPFHIFELNVLSLLLIAGIFSSFGLGNFESYIAHSFAEFSVYFCAVINFCEAALRISVDGGLIAIQVDRFLGLYLNLSYDETLDTEKSSKVIIGIIMLSCLITSLGAVMDPEILSCNTEENMKLPPACSFLRETSIYWFTLPRTIHFLVMMVVTVYVMRIIVKHHNHVVPVVSVNAAPVNDNQGATQDESHNASHDVAGPSRGIIKQVNSIGQSIQSIDVVAAKKILSVNLQTLVVFLAFFPMNVFYVKASVWGENCFTTPQMIPYLKASATLQFVMFMVIYVLVVWRRFLKYLE